MFVYNCEISMFDKSFFYSCQLALFVGSGTVRADDLSSLIRSRLDIGEYEPMLIPEQPGMPAEFPRLHINTAEGYRLSMSKARIDFILELPLGLDKSHIDSFKVKCEALGSLLGEKGFNFTRIGWVKNAFSQSDTPAQDMIEALAKFSSEQVSDFSMSVTKKVTIGDWCANSLYTITNGVGPAGLTGVVCVRDINNDPLHPVVIAASQVGRIVEDFDRVASLDSIELFVNGGEGLF